jgi:hypothetical protein
MVACAEGQSTCLASGGSVSSCDNVWQACRQVAESGTGSQIAACYGDYAQCGFTAVQQHIARLQSNPLEPDDPCLVSARDDYYGCLEGGNSDCISNSSVISSCCEGRFNKDWNACLGNFGP